MRLFNVEKLVPVIESILVTRAIDQPEFVTLVALGLLKEPVHDPANGRYSSSGGNEHRIVTGLAEREHPVRPVKLDSRTFFQIAQPVRQESLFHAIQAKVKFRARARRGSEGIGTGVRFAVRLRLLDRHELAGDEFELMYSLDRELEVLGLLREEDGTDQAGSKKLPLARLTNGGLNYRNLIQITHDSN
jgi:hypothetical protein